MSLKTYLTAAAALLLAATAWAAPDLVIPAAASADGPNGSRWQSEITIHNAGTQEITAVLTLHGVNGPAGSPATVRVNARSTVVLDDVVRTLFGMAAPVGAVTIDLDDVAVRKVAVSSRTFNTNSLGEFGQDIPAIPAGSAMVLGDTVVLAGPSNAAASRFNFGIFALEATTVEWKLLRQDGAIASTTTQTYDAGQHLQYSSGVSSLFNVQPQNADTVHARINGGRAMLYGSAVNNLSNDPTFVHAVRTRENLSVEIIGIDLDEDGNADILDADGDGVLDEVIVVPTARFPSYFRIIALDPEGAAITFSFVNPPRDVSLIDSIGTVQWYPSSELSGTSGSLTVRASDGIDHADLIIPVRFQ
jgi:hypothetical protein